MPHVRLYKPSCGRMAVGRGALVRACADCDAIEPVVAVRLGSGLRSRLQAVDVAAASRVPGVVVVAEDVDGVILGTDLGRGHPQDSTTVARASGSRRAGTGADRCVALARDGDTRARSVSTALDDRSPSGVDRLLHEDYSVHQVMPRGSVRRRAAIEELLVRELLGRTTVGELLDDLE